MLLSKKCRLLSCAVLVLSLVFSCFSSSAFAESYYAGDGHVHTYLSGEIGLTTGATIDKWTNIAKNKDMDWVAITDHSDLVLYNKWFKDELTLPEWSTLQKETNINWGMPVLLGEEVTIGNGRDTKTKGHLLTYNINNPIQVFERPIATTEAKGSTPNRRRSANEILPDIRFQKGISFIAHPYKSPDTWQAWDSANNNLDIIKGMELFSAGRFQGNAALKKWQGFLKQQRPFWVVGNSDSHDISQAIPFLPRMASSYTSLIASGSSETDILNALKNGRAVASNGPSLSLTVNGKYPGDTIRDIAVGSKLNVNIGWNSTSEQGNPTRIRIYDQSRDLTGAGTPINISGLTGSISFDYEVKGKGYILAKVETDKGKTAYTNPIFIKPAGIRSRPASNNVSVALIIDCSGSMSWNDNKGLRKEAAKLFIDLAQPGDKIAIVGFSSGAYSLAGLREIRSSADRQALKSAVDRVSAWGGTNIDVALRVGYNELSSDGSGNRKAAILLTDGEHNGGTYHNPQLLFRDKGWPIFTVGLGTSTDPSFLSRIAADTGGKYYSTYSADGISEIYFMLSQIVRGGSSIYNSSTNIQQGQTLDKIAYVSSNNMQATFSTHWSGSDVKLTLIAPDGTMIDRNVDDPDISHTKGATYEIYRIDNPIPGDWTMRIEGIDIPQGGEEVKLDVSGIQETPPEVAIASPADSSIIRGTVNILTEAKDDKVIEDFELYLNGDLAKSAENTGTAQASIAYTWDTSGTPDGYYHFAAMAFDPDSSSGQDDIILIVDNVMPVANAGSDQKVRAGDEVTFNASGSKDVDWFGYYWDFGDGTTETAAGPIITHTYAKRGKYTATLTVTDEAGNTATDTAKVKVLHQRGNGSTEPGDTDEPSVPKGLKCNLGNNMIHLVWSPNKENDLAGYNIYRKEGNAEPVKLNTDPIRDVQFQDRAANPNITYTYFVTAEDEAGNESDPSNQVEAALRVAQG